MSTGSYIFCWLLAAFLIWLHLPLITHRHDPPASDAFLAMQYSWQRRTILGSIRKWLWGR